MGLGPGTWGSWPVKKGGPDAAARGVGPVGREKRGGGLLMLQPVMDLRCGMGLQACVKGLWSERTWGRGYGGSTVWGSSGWQRNQGRGGCEGGWRRRYNGGSEGRGGSGSSVCEVEAGWRAQRRRWERGGVGDGDGGERWGERWVVDLGLDERVRPLGGEDRQGGAEVDDLDSGVPSGGLGGRGPDQGLERLWWCSLTLAAGDATARLSRSGFNSSWPRTTAEQGHPAMARRTQGGVARDEMGWR